MLSAGDPEVTPVTPGPGLMKSLVQWRRQAGPSIRPCSRVVRAGMAEPRGGFWPEPGWEDPYRQVEVETGICEPRSKT